MLVGRGRLHAASGKKNRADHSFGESVLATFSEEAQLIGDDYRRWSAAGELCLLNRKGLIDSDARRHSGRGGDVKFRVGPLQPKAPLETSGCHGGHSQFWSMISARVLELHLLRSRGKGLEQ